VIAAAAQGSGPGQYTMTSYYRDDLAALPEMGVVAIHRLQVEGSDSRKELRIMEKCPFPTNNSFSLRPHSTDRKPNLA
jgi:hypothetical protein